MLELTCCVEEEMWQQKKVSLDTKRMFSNFQPSK